MSIATIVDALVEAGATPQMIAAAVRAHAQKDEEARAEKRAKDAERQRRHRMSTESRGVTRGHSDIADAVHTPLISHEKIQTTKSNQVSAAIYPEEIIKKDKGNSRQNGKSLPEGWLPSPNTISAIKARGVSDDLLAACLTDMRLWAESNRNRAVARKADWDSTFLGWCRREADKRKIPVPAVSTVFTPSAGPAPRMKTVAEIEAQIEQRRMELGADGEDDSDRRDVSAGGVAAHEGEAAQPGWDDRRAAPRGYARSTVVGLVSAPDRVSERAAAGAGKSWKTLHGARADAHGLRPGLEGPEAGEPAAYPPRNTAYGG